MTPDEMMMLDAMIHSLPDAWGDAWGDAAALDHAINNELPGA
jgi:hypothetical protein